MSRAGKGCQLRFSLRLEAYQTYRLQEYRKEFPDADEKKLSACETPINKDLAVLRMVLYRGHALEKLAAVPPFPPKLQGAMERAGTVTEEQFRVMLADCGNDEVWFKSDVADVVYLGLSSRGATQNALHPSQSNRPDCVSAAQVDEEQEAAAYSHQR